MSTLKNEQLRITSSRKKPSSLRAFTHGPVFRQAITRFLFQGLAGHYPLLFSCLLVSNCQVQPVPIIWVSNREGIDNEATGVRSQQVCNSLQQLNAKTIGMST